MTERKWQDFYSQTIGPNAAKLLGLVGLVTLAAQLTSSTKILGWRLSTVFFLLAFYLWWRHVRLAKKPIEGTDGPTGPEYPKRSTRVLASLLLASSAILVCVAGGTWIRLKWSAIVPSVKLRIVNETSSSITFRDRATGNILHPTATGAPSVRKLTRLDLFPSMGDGLLRVAPKESIDVDARFSEPGKVVDDLGTKEATLELLLESEEYRKRFVLQDMEFSRDALRDTRFVHTLKQDDGRGPGGDYVLDPCEVASQPEPGYTIPEPGWELKLAEAVFVHAGKATDVRLKDDPDDPLQVVTVAQCDFAQELNGQIDKNTSVRVVGVVQGGNRPNGECHVRLSTGRISRN